MLITTLLTCVAAASACTKGEGDSPARPASADPDVGKSFPVMVGAAGGVVSHSSGRAALTVPSQALGTDTMITLAVGARESGTLSSVYDFAPEGLQFATPASLSVRFDGQPGTRTRVVLAVNEGGAWQPLPDSRFVQGSVSASIAHFSRYSIVERAAIQCGDNIREGSDVRQESGGTGAVAMSGTGDAPGGGTEGSSSTTTVSICDMDDTDCADGIERDFACTATTCTCEQNDAVVKTVTNEGLCKGGESDRDVAELANAACGWNIVLVDQNDDDDSNGAKDAEGANRPSCAEVIYVNGEKMKSSDVPFCDEPGACNRSSVCKPPASWNFTRMLQGAACVTYHCTTPPCSYELCASNEDIHCRVDNGSLIECGPKNNPFPPPPPPGP